MNLNDRYIDILQEAMGVADELIEHYKLDEEEESNIHNLSFYTMLSSLEKLVEIEFENIKAHVKKCIFNEITAYITFQKIMENADFRFYYYEDYEDEK